MRKDRSTQILLNQLVQVEAPLTNHKSEDTNSAERAFVFEAEDYATGASRARARARARARRDRNPRRSPRPPAPLLAL